MSEHPSPFVLESWHAEGQPDASPTAAHVADCDACRATVDGLSAAREALVAREAPDAFARRIRAAADAPAAADAQPWWLRFWWVHVVGGAAIAVALVFVVLPTPPAGPGVRGGGPLTPGGGDVVRLKGDLGLAVVVQPAQGTQQRHANDVTLAAGDRFRVELTVPSEQVVTVGILQGDGTWTPLLDAERRQPGAITLERTFSVDEAPLSARVLAGSPAAVAAARDTGDLSGVAVLRLTSAAPR